MSNDRLRVIAMLAWILEWPLLYELSQKNVLTAGMRRIVLALLRREVANGAEQRVVEVGCGTGLYLSALSRTVLVMYDYASARTIPVPESFKDRVRVSYIDPNAQTQPPSTTSEYHRDNRVLDITFKAPLERFRTVKIELLEGVTATDGAAFAPYALTFSVGAGG